MGITRRHGIYAVELFDSSQSSAVVLDGVSSQGINFGNTVAEDGSSDSPYNRFIPLTAQQINGSVSSMRVKDWLSTLGVLGYHFVPDTGKPGLNLYWQKHAEVAAGRDSGSNHEKYTIASGCVFPQNLSVAHRGDASITYGIQARYDGTNSPIVQATGQSVPALTGDSDRFTLGPVDINGIVLEHKTAISIDFGVSIVPESSDSDVWPTFLNLVRVRPRITFSGVDATALTALTLNGQCGTHANASFFLRKRTECGASFVADDQSEHIKFTAAGKLMIENQNGSHEGNVSNSLTLYTKFDGTNAPLVVALDQQIAASP